MLNAEREHDRAWQQPRFCCRPDWQLASRRSPQHHCTAGGTHSTPPRTTLTGRFRWWDIASALLPCTHAWSACCRDKCNGLNGAGSVIEMQQSRCTSSRLIRKVHSHLSRFGGIQSCHFLDKHMKQPAGAMACHASEGQSCGHSHVAHACPSCLPCLCSQSGLHGPHHPHSHLQKHFS